MVRLYDTKRQAEWKMTRKVKRCARIIRTTQFGVMRAEKNTAHTKFYMVELRQFQFTVAYKFVHHYQKNDTNGECIVSFTYFSIHKKFPALRG